MQQLPPTDPKIDVKIRCIWCAALVSFPCEQVEDFEDCLPFHKMQKRDYLRQKRHEKTLHL